MALFVRDGLGNLQAEPVWIDNVYRGVATIAAASATTGCDVVLFTGAGATTSLIARLLDIKATLLGGGGVTTGATVALSLVQCTAAPTGQTNTVIKLASHNPTAPAASSTFAATPSASQTRGTTTTTFAEGAVGVNSATGFDITVAKLDCGPEQMQFPIEVPAGGFFTLRIGSALPASSTLVVDFMFSEAPF